MQLGLGLYRHMLTPENFRFARQAGARAIVAHLCDYFAEGPRIPTTGEQGWGQAGRGLEIWEPENLRALKQSVEAEGLALAAVENLDPMLWYDVLLDGPRKAEQLETVKRIIRSFGEVGIPILGYSFSIAGVWGHVEGPYARGGAETVAFLGPDGPAETPIPNGMVWNMIYDASAPPGEPLTVTASNSGSGWTIFWRRCCRSRKRRACSLRCIRTIRPCLRCAGRRASSTSRPSTRSCSICAPARPTSWNSASARWRRCLRAIFTGGRYLQPPERACLRAFPQRARQGPALLRGVSRRR